MKYTICFVLALFSGLYCPAKAQDQSGSVEIAKSAAPTDTLVVVYTDCLTVSVKAGLSAEKAAETCLKVVRLEKERGNKNANEAADATKASGNQWGNDGWGSRSYWGGRVTYTRPSRWRR